MARTSTLTIALGLSLLFGGALTLVTDGALFGVATLALGESREAASWTETRCEVLSSRIVEEVGPDSTSWSARVSWRYRVGGDRYEILDQSPEAFGIAWDRAGAQAQVARFPAGAKVPCWYDPTDPGRSTLDRDAPPWGAWVLPVAAGAGLFGGVVSGVGGLIVLAGVIASRLKARLHPD